MTEIQKRRKKPKSQEEQNSGVNPDYSGWWMLGEMLRCLEKTAAIFCRTKKEVNHMM